VVTRTIAWDALIAQADPDHARKNRRNVEYEFSSPGASRTGNKDTHRGNRRVFMGDYATRGPYTPQTPGEDALLWNGTPLTFGGEEIDWGVE
jgi:hypothetical protein